MSNLRPVSSMPIAFASILNRDSESGVRLMQTAIFMAKQDSVLRTAFLLVCTVALRLGAQVVETPMPFDSAGKIRSVTPALAERFHLAPPTWPLSGDFVEARLFAVSGGGTVLVAQQRSGALLRYALRDEERDALREAIDHAMAESGAVVSESQIASPNARGAFVRNQMILSAIVYGPLLASLTHDGRSATAVYLLSVSG